MFPWKSGWSQDWYKGLLPKYARKGPSKKSDDQKEMLKEKLKNEQYTTSQVRDIIMEDLKKRIISYIEETNSEPVVFTWKYRMDEMPGGIGA